MLVGLTIRSTKPNQIGYEVLSRKIPETKGKDRKDSGCLRGNAAGTAEMAAMHNPESWRNVKGQRLGIAMNGAYWQICNCKFMPKISMA